MTKRKVLMPKIVRNSDMRPLCIFVDRLKALEIASANCLKQYVRVDALDADVDNDLVLALKVFER